MSDSSMKTATVMYATSVRVQCPHCGAVEDGFIGNPAGKAFECDSCKQPYRIHPEADIEFQP
jgi:predicted RNA-binding Zn-ribbon protein involved in translation (DUF1610 family)